MGLILGVVVINIAIGMVQEGKAESAAEALKAMLSSSADVLRNGERVSIEAELVVPGDILFVKSGDRIPADMRMMQTTNLQVSVIRLLLLLRCPAACSCCCCL
jgi:P-type E1-E2 ATPase